MRNVFLSITTILGLAMLLVFMASGCGNKKPKGKTADDVDAGVADAGLDEEEIAEEEVAEGGETTDTGSGSETGTGDTGSGDTGSGDTGSGYAEPEPVKGPAKFPPHPANDWSNRQNKQYLVSIKKAQIIPAKPTGECWDDCTGEAAMAIGAAVSKVGALPPTSQSGFDYAAKGLGVAVNLVGGAEAFPDVFVHMRCGHGQGHKTHVAKNKMVATWTYENKKLTLDERDECVISIWDKDDDGDEELGRTTVPLVQKAKAGGGKAILYAANEGLGMVYSIEIGVSEVGGGSSGGGASSGGGESSGGGGGVAGLIGGLIGEVTGGGSGDSGGGSKEPSVQKSSYSIEIVKAKVSQKKKDGADWDSVPKKAQGLLGALGGKAGGVKPDVFVEAWVNGYKSKAPFMTTSAKNENFYPVWNETGGFNLLDTDHINFMVWDKDAASHDLIGECKTKPMGKQYTGEVWLKNCGQVEYLLVKITKN